MAGRSLTATPNGITRAKQTLEKRQLSQRRLTTELGYSWATINKFFTGKPVDRFYFVEICNHLNLDWETLITDSAPPTPEITPLLQAVQTQAAAARQTLTPRILDRIPREVVRQKYLPAIDRGLTGEQQRIIPIIGPAGYGKSTILGDLYDHLTAAQTSWIGLILCSSITPNLQSALIATSFGKSLCGDDISIIEVVEKLNAKQGRGVLLIDTIDLLINRDFTPTFATLLRQLLHHGATIVFTCRDHEYNDHLEPTHERSPDSPTPSIATPSPTSPPPKSAPPPPNFFKSSIIIPIMASYSPIDSSPSPPTTDRSSKSSKTHSCWLSSATSSPKTKTFPPTSPLANSTNATGKRKSPTAAPTKAATSPSRSKKKTSV